MKAFAVLEENENTGGIVFADSAVVARRNGASIFSDGEFSCVSCQRAAWADEFAETGIVPAKVMIENGWHFECAGCGETIDEDWLNEEDLPLAGVIGQQHSKIYCCEICQCRDKLNDAIKRDHEHRAILALQWFVHKRFPGVAFATRDNWKPHAYASQRNGTWQVQQVVVSFEFPGMRIGAATCRIERESSFYRGAHLIGPIWPQFSCCGGDRETFEAWAASPQSRMKAGEAAT
jgi:hypothetical protein